jgi:hypothetical protein
MGLGLMDRGNISGTRIMGIEEIFGTRIYSLG